MPHPSHQATRAQTDTANPTEVVVALPLDYTAFCLLHQHHYLRYARARIRRPSSAEHAVAGALGDLAITWHSALCSSAPAAWAWDLLRRRIRQAARAPFDTDTLHRMLPDEQADTVVLRHRLLLNYTQTAALMGLEPCTVVAHLAAAHRTLHRSATPRTTLDQ